MPELYAFIRKGSVDDISRIRTPQDLLGLNTHNYAVFRGEGGKEFNKYDKDPDFQKITLSEEKTALDIDPLH